MRHLILTNILENQNCSASENMLKAMCVIKMFDHPKRRKDSSCLCDYFCHFNDHRIFVLRLKKIKNSKLIPEKGASLNSTSLDGVL